MRGVPEGRRGWGTPPEGSRGWWGELLREGGAVGGFCGKEGLGAPPKGMGSSGGRARTPAVALARLG